MDVMETLKKYKWAIIGLVVIVAAYKLGYLQKGYAYVKAKMA